MAVILVNYAVKKPLDMQFFTLKTSLKVDQMPAQLSNHQLHNPQL